MLRTRLLRRDRPALVGLMAGGYLVAMLGLLLAFGAGQGAVTAVFLAAIGATLITIGTERSRAESVRKRSSSDDTFDPT